LPRPFGRCLKSSTSRISTRRITSNPSSHGEMSRLNTPNTLSPFGPFNAAQLSASSPSSLHTPNMGYRLSVHVSDSPTPPYQPSASFTSTNEPPRFHTSARGVKLMNSRQSPVTSNSQLFAVQTKLLDIRLFVSLIRTRLRRNEGGGATVQPLESSRHRASGSKTT